MFKKRRKTGVKHSPFTPSPYRLKADSSEWKNWLNTVTSFCNSAPAEVNALFTHRPFDNRAYVPVQIQHEKVLAFMDSGANQSVLGRKGLYLLDKLNLKINRLNKVPMRSADGTLQNVYGTVLIPLTVEGVTKKLTVIVSDTIEYPLILGYEFCKLFKMKTDFENDSFTVPNDLNTLTSPKIIHSRADLSFNQIEQLEKVISKFRAIAPDKLGRTHMVNHIIDTGNALSIKQRYYPLSPALLEQVNLEVDKMIKDQVIKPSFSSWNSPILLVKKRSGENRFCFDGRRLNEVTKPDAYPMPYITTILDQLRDARYISSIDLKKAFWQIPLSAESCEKTAFTVPGRGLFEFNVLPFGLHNSPQTLQRLMDKIFGPKFDKVFVYLDDIIIVSSTFEEHISLLKEVYERLKKAGLNVNFEKCEFCRNSLKYLGFVVDAQGLRTDPSKVEAIVNFPTPRTSTEIKRFLGMSGWYRRFIPNFSTLAAPILKLLKGKSKRQKVIWGQEADDAFKNLKNKLVSAPILSSPDFSQPFIIQTDASDSGLGAILVQGEGKEERVIAYASRTLNKHELNYHAMEKECCAILFGIDKYRPYIEGSRFTVITDNQALKWMGSVKSPLGRIARWAVRLNQYDFEIIHRKGKLNVVADALSRAPINIHYIALTPDDKSTWYQKVIDKIISNPEGYPNFKIEDGYVYKFVPNKHNFVSNLIEWKLLVPKSRRREIMNDCHDNPLSGHLGVFKTFNKISEIYYWPRMKSDISRYVLKCEICIASKASNQLRPGLMGNSKRVEYPFQILSIDLMGPFPRTKKGNTCLLVISDWFSKFVLVHPLRQATAASIVQKIEEVFLLFGVPQIVMCDNGTQFTGKIFKDLMDEYKVQKIWYTAAYHPQSNPVERSNRVIGTCLRSFVEKDHRSWDLHVYKIAHAIRNAVHEVTGYTPSFLNLGRSVPNNGTYYGRLDNATPGEFEVGGHERVISDTNNSSELYQEVIKKLQHAYERNKARYNIRKRPLSFKKGDTVWKRNFVLSSASDKFAKKFAPKYVKCKVAEVTGNLTYRLRSEHGKNLGIFHVKDLKAHPE